jgi:hypothetical protein
VKKLFALVALLCCTLAVCCAPPPLASPTIAALAPEAGPLQRDFGLTLHVDTAFDGIGREIIEKAGQNIRALTHDRARLELVFDLDFDAPAPDAHESLVVGVLSTFKIVHTLEEVIGGGGQLVAVTVPTKFDTTWVLLIMDRIEPEDFEAVVTHEFGHVIGLPDLPTMGSIMSGARVEGTAPLHAWTAADVELCRKFQYCD